MGKAGDYGQKFGERNNLIGGDEMLDRIEEKKFKDVVEILRRDDSARECLDDLCRRIERWFSKKMNQENKDQNPDLGRD